MLKTYKIYLEHVEPKGIYEFKEDEHFIYYPFTINNMPTELAKEIATKLKEIRNN